MRRPQALHAAALLIDQHEHLVAFDRILEGGDRARGSAPGVSQLRAKRMSPQGRVGGKEAPLGVAERGARAARDEGFEVHDAG